MSRLADAPRLNPQGRATHVQTLTTTHQSSGSLTGLMNDDAQVITLNEVIRFLRRYGLALVGAALLAGVVAYVASTFATPIYESRAIVLAAQTNPEFRQFGMGIATAAPLDVSVYRTAALTPQVLEDARERALRAGLAAAPSVGGLRSLTTITTEARGTSSLMTIAVRHEDRVAAATLANAVADAAVAWDQRRARSAIEDLIHSLTLQIEALDQQIAELANRNDVTPDQVAGRVTLRAEQQEQLYYARVLSGSASGLLSVLQGAEVPGGPISPRPARNAVVAAVLTVVLVALFGLLRDVLDTRLRTIDHVTELTNLPLLAAFPVLADNTRVAPREASNFLRANVGFATANAHPKVIAVTSAGPGEGKTTVAVSLATSFARQDYRVLLVDLDLRKPMVSQAFGITATGPHVHTLMARHGAPLEAQTVMLAPDVALDVLPAVQVSDHPAERIATGIGSLLSRAQEDYDVIVIDTAPTLAVADTLPIASLATSTILAVSIARSNRRQVTAAMEVLRRNGATLTGMVVTHTPQGSEAPGGYGYGYGYGYGSAYGQPEVAKARS